jgi:hypothetical protein
VVNKEIPNTTTVPVKKRCVFIAFPIVLRFSIATNDQKIFIGFNHKWISNDHHSSVNIEECRLLKRKLEGAKKKTLLEQWRLFTP